LGEFQTIDIDIVVKVSRFITKTGGCMNNGPSLVLRGTIIGSLVVGLLGWLLAGHIKIFSEAEVAYAASATTTEEPTQAPAEIQPVGEKCAVNSSYPARIQGWCEIITHDADLAGLSPNLVAAVILQESGGNADAFSASGAVGLMQVMPRDGIAATFECINGPCFASRPTIEELLDPSFNVEYGTKMLARLITRMEDVRDALKMYGPMDVGYSYADKVLAIYENYR
jgi:soluble lytic murein transglycosylase-like protein